jgi:hypothetical protein
MRANPVTFKYTKNGKVKELTYRPLLDIQTLQPIDDIMERTWRVLYNNGHTFHRLRPDEWDEFEQRGEVEIAWGRKIYHYKLI